MDNEGMSGSQLLNQANRLKRAGRLDEAIALLLSGYKILNWNLDRLFYSDKAAIN